MCSLTTKDAGGLELGAAAKGSGDLLDLLR